MNTLVDAAALESAAEHKVQTVFNTFLQKRSNELEFIAQLVEICRAQPNAAWQALSQLDQLHRRHVLTSELHRTVKEKLNEIVFGSTGTSYVAIPRKKLDKESDLRAVIAGLPSKLEEAPPSESRQTMPQRSANATLFQPLRPGSLLNDRYLIVEPLAAGAASMTFKALDRCREGLPEAERHVAIRWLDENLQSDPHALVALQNEYAHLQAIAHPNIPKVYDIREVPGSYSIVMELPAGEFLNRIAEHGAAKCTSQALALTIVREIGFAVVNAHAAGIVHGGLHAGSVLIAHNGEVRVYGFAQADSWIQAGTHADTQPEAYSRPPPIALRRYCSPQRRKSASCTAADDVYSLACIAYELLCGRFLEIDALRADGWRQPNYAKHLSERQWSTLRSGLADSPAERGNRIWDWLAQLGMKKARWRLPSLTELEVELGS